MCGIVGVFDRQNQAQEKVLRGLEALEYRGYDSWGIAGINEAGSMWVEKQVGNIYARSKTKVVPESNWTIGHTRWATHGGVTKTNAHPHCDCEGRYAVVHNGVIENFHELKLSLGSKFKFRSETDTEVVAHLMAKLPQKMSLSNKLKQVSMKLKGHNALVVLDRQTQQIGAVSLGSPLLIATGKSAQWVASDVLALDKEVIKYLPLNQGEVATIQDDHWQIKGKKKITRWLSVPEKSQPIRAGKAGEMMVAELKSSPEIIQRSMKVDLSELKEKLSPNKPLWITGAGTAHHAALWGAHWLRKSGYWAQAFSTTEPDTYLKIMNPTDSLLLISQSGETRDTLTVAERAKALGMVTFGMVNRQHSTLSRLVNHEILTPAGVENAVLATKSLTSQLILLWRLAQRNNSNKTIETVVKKVALMLSTYDPKVFKKTAKMLAANSWTIILGEGSGWILALEAALKLKEGAYLAAEGLAGGELKHGSLALIEPNRLCLALDVDPDNSLGLHHHLTEAKARGATIVGVSPKQSELYDVWLPLPDLGSLTVIGGLVAIQLLTYMTAVKRGINPDRPRNLAKSVTVV